MPTQPEFFEPLPQAPYAPAFYAETAPRGMPTPPAEKLEVFARHQVLVTLAAGLGIDQRRQCRDKFVAALDGVQQTIADSDLGKRKARLAERIRETETQLREMQSTQAAAEQRHHAALAADDEGQLGAARKCVLSAGLELVIVADELAVLSRLHSEAANEAEAERLRLVPLVRSSLVDQAEGQIDRLTAELWDAIHSPELRAKMELLILVTGLRAICGRSPQHFERNSEQYVLTNTITG